MIAWQYAFAADHAPDLGAAADAATVVVLGQVERIERRAGRSIATMTVSHVAKGEATSHVTFWADPIGDYQPSASLGDDRLVLLEPAPDGPGEPRLRVALSGAASLRAFRRGDVWYVAMSQYGGVRFPVSLCDPKVTFGRYECVARLDRVLQHAKLQAPNPGKRSGGATFRVEEPRRCDPCNLDTWLGEFTEKGALVCRGTRKDGGRGASECVQDALESDRSFVVQVSHQGIDSTILEAFGRRGARLFRLSYDSSVEGGGACSARVAVEECGSLQVMPAGDDPEIECLAPQAARVLCAQRADRIEALGPVKPVGMLRCRSGSTRDGFEECRAGSKEKRGVTPPADGPDLVCSSRYSTLFCRSE